MSAPTTGMSPTLEAWRRRIDDRIAEVVDDLERDGPEHDDPLIRRVYRWLRHYLDIGGKRIHGLTVVLAHRACTGEAGTDILRVAAGMQLYHHHTLVHDDIYDEDVSRRGWPTSHMAFAALLADAGDAAETAPHPLFVREDLRRGAITAFAYGKVCRALAGQALLDSTFPAEARIAAASTLDRHDLYDNAAQLKDVGFEGTAMPSADACLANAWLKTGRLYEVCADIGALLAGARPSRRSALTTWAGQTGIAYQLTDDLEDLNADSEKGQGRGVATDLLRRKGTYLFALATALATGADRDTLTAWQSGADTGADAAAVTDILYRCGAVAACRGEVERCLHRAAAALDAAEPAFDPAVVTEMVDFSRYGASPGYWRRTIVNDPARARALLA